ncbi:4-hydroxyphenylacetate 3-hydroxylase family protein [Paenibacillus popilliae]|uniref:Aromatic ring hydroxylase n=1 Tax=Paenibacillus popilliae ATCC 14706 TaxID=1212764 RepID=M9LCE8_PAEPP|nr:4-hydroxyphenylacetate 3-hydroxylase N-terminal domain-containing protein [Paenibacillus popilliae]GAC43747.1 aromatic ring hydroxylase [Paenibacillus popilliae ATCC 14706]
MESSHILTLPSRYLRRIHGRSSVFLNGERVKVTEEPALAGAIKCIERYYELQEEKPDIHCFIDEKGNSAPTSLLIPKSVNDLQKKRESYKAVADVSFGMLGRTPDFMNAALVAMSTHSNGLGIGKYADYSKNMIEYYAYVKKNNLFIGHGAINPQIDRSLPLGSQVNPYAAVRVISRDRHGIVVTGAKMIVTLAPIADELLIFNMPGLTPGDEDYALAFALQLDQPGVNIVCRKPLGKPAYHHFDYPLSNRFDEIDAYLILNEVFIPWNNVFVFRDVTQSNLFYDQTFARNHTGHQGIVRGLSKAEFLTGISIKLAQMLKLDGLMNIQEKLGELTSCIELLKASILLSEADAFVSDAGVLTPSGNAIQAIRYHFPRMYEQMIKTIQSLAAGSMLSTPHYQDFLAEELVDLQTALTTGDMNAHSRTQLLNLAWDASGESFGQRQLVYEYYHAGDPTRIAAGHYVSFDKEHMLQMVERALTHDNT